MIADELNICFDNCDSFRIYNDSNSKDYKQQCLKKGCYSTDVIYWHIDEFKKYIEDEDLMIFSIQGRSIAINPDDPEAVNKIKSFISQCCGHYNIDIKMTNIFTHGTTGYTHEYKETFYKACNIDNTLNIYLPNIPHKGLIATNKGCKGRAEKYSRIIQKVFNDKDKIEYKNKNTNENQKCFAGNKVFTNSVSYGNLMMANVVKNLAENCEDIEIATCLSMIAHGVLFFQNYNDIADVFNSIKEENRDKIKKIFISGPTNLFHTANNGKNLYNLLYKNYEDKAIFLNNDMRIQCNGDNGLYLKYFFDKPFKLKSTGVAKVISSSLLFDNNVYKAEFGYNAAECFDEESTEAYNTVEYLDEQLTKKLSIVSKKSNQEKNFSSIVFDIDQDDVNSFITECKKIKEAFLSKNNSSWSCCGVDVLDDKRISLYKTQNNSNKKEDEKVSQSNQEIKKDDLGNPEFNEVKIIGYEKIQIDPNLDGKKQAEDYCKKYGLKFVSMEPPEEGCIKVRIERSEMVKSSSPLIVQPINNIKEDSNKKTLKDILCLNHKKKNKFYNKTNKNRPKSACNNKKNSSLIIPLEDYNKQSSLQDILCFNRKRKKKVDNKTNKNRPKSAIEKSKKNPIRRKHSINSEKPKTNTKNLFNIIQFKN